MEWEWNFLPEAACENIYIAMRNKILQKKSIVRFRAERQMSSYWYANFIISWIPYFRCLEDDFVRISVIAVQSREKLAFIVVKKLCECNQIPHARERSVKIEFKINIMRGRHTRNAYMRTVSRDFSLINSHAVYYGYTVRGLVLVIRTDTGPARNGEFTRQGPMKRIV